MDIFLGHNEDNFFKDFARAFVNIMLLIFSKEDLLSKKLLT